MSYKHFSSALKGRYEWSRIKKEYKLKEGVLVLLMTDKNEKINYFALKHLDSYRTKKYMDSVIILTDQIRVQEMQQEMQTACTDVVWLDSDKCENLKKYYQLQLFYSYFLLVSVNQPDGNTVGNMLKSGKITEEELVLGSIYV